MQSQKLRPVQKSAPGLLLYLLGKLEVCICLPVIIRVHEVQINTFFERQTMNIFLSISFNVSPIVKVNHLKTCVKQPLS